MSSIPSPTISANPKPLSTKPSSSLSFAAAPCRRFARSARAIAAPEPPWLVPSPVRRTPSHGRIDLPHHRLSSSSTGRIPISLRLVQLQKKSLASRRRPDDPSALGPIGGPIWSLICLLEELHKSAIFVGDEVDRDRVFWESTEPLVWLFLRVFSASPNLLSEILTLTANLVAQSVERCVTEAVESVFDLEVEAVESVGDAERRSPTGATGESAEMGEYGSWADIGILDDDERDKSDSRRSEQRRWRSRYESMIVREKQPNSLLLANYAQFLYQIERDLERAPEYFKLAVMSEPVDGEAMNKYAKFLWLERGDIEGAEEMFLEAIKADPTNSYLQSSYANFLFQTGGDETCFPLDYGGADADSQAS